MTKVTVIDFSKQKIDLSKLIPDNADVVLAPKCNLDATVFGGSLIDLIHRFLDNLIRTPMFDINDPVYIIINSTAQAFATSLFLKTYFSTVFTPVTVWILRNVTDDNGVYLDMNRFEMEGMDRGRTYLEILRTMLDVTVS